MLPSLLTDREAIILWDYCHGLEAKQVAYKHGIAHQTVRNYTKDIYRKFENAGIIRESSNPKVLSCVAFYKAMLKEGVPWDPPTEVSSEPTGKP